MTNLDSILKRRDITLPTKVHLVKAMVFPVVISGYESWTIKKTAAAAAKSLQSCPTLCYPIDGSLPGSTEELMLLNCGVGEDSWESLGWQGDPTSPSQRRSVLCVHWKDWCWNSNILATWCEGLIHLKRPDVGKDWGQEEKGMTEDEMAGWHHRDSIDMSFGGLWELVMYREACRTAVHGVTKSWTRLSDWTELKGQHETKLDGIVLDCQAVQENLPKL